MVLDALGPVVREEDRRLGELHDVRAKGGALVLEDVYKLEERHTRKSLRTLYSRMWYILRIEPWLYGIRSQCPEYVRSERNLPKLRYINNSGRTLTKVLRLEYAGRTRDAHAVDLHAPRMSQEVDVRRKPTSMVSASRAHEISRQERG